MTTYPTLEQIQWGKYNLAQEVKVDPKGRKTASAKHPDFPNGIVFQVNSDCEQLLKIPFDIRENEKKKSDVTSYDMNLTITDENMQKCFDDMTNAIIEGASKNSTSWFKGPKTKKEVMADYMSPFKRAAEEKYDPLLKVKVTVCHTNDKSLETKIFKHSMQTDANGDLIGEPEETDISALTRGARVMLIVKMSQPWFMQSKNFGVTLYCERIMVQDTPDESPSQFYFGSKKNKRPTDDATLDAALDAALDSTRLDKRIKTETEPSPEE